MLGPDEQFTVLSLSGEKPKRPHVIKSLSLQLGPDFMTDIVIVETADHARLSLKLSYNWHFDRTEAHDDVAKIFSVPDFVGDACKAIASRVRGEVALHSFDEFHRNSAKIIRTAVFGVDDNQKVRNRFSFAANNLVISNIDIQSVEPVDSRTRDALQKSVQLAIEILPSPKKQLLVMKLLDVNKKPVVNLIAKRLLMKLRPNPHVNLCLNSKLPAQPLSPPVLPRQRQRPKQLELRSKVWLL